MHLIIGGAWQGKLAFAKEEFGLAEEGVTRCRSDNTPDFSRPCVYGLEQFTLFCARQNKSARHFFAERQALWKNHILICTDLSSGVVPVDPLMRLWREETGQLLNYLAREAETVTRLFCGLPQRLKP